MIAIGFVTTRRSSIAGWRLGFEPLRALGVALAEEADQLLHLRPDYVRVDADAAHAAELEEGQDEVVVAGVQVELGLGEDRAGLVEVGVRLLDSLHVRDLASSHIVSGSMLRTTRAGML